MGNILWTNCDFIFHFRCPDTFSFLGNLLSLERTSLRDNLNSQIQIFCCYASLKWTFFVLFIHNLRPSNRFCCLSLFKASRVWKILMTLSKQQLSFGIFSQSLFASLPNIYYWVSFITNCISWQPILAQNSCDEVSWEFKQNPQLFNINPEVILFHINELILLFFLSDVSYILCQVNTLNTHRFNHWYQITIHIISCVTFQFWSVAKSRISVCVSCRWINNWLSHQTWYWDFAKPHRNKYEQIALSNSTT